MPEPGAVITGPKVRFTILTDRLIRMEFSPQDHFENKPSQVFWYRCQPAPQYRLEVSGTRIDIETDYLHLEYSINDLGFTPKTLKVLVKSTGAVWRYGDPTSRSQNLGGTARTLDEASGRIRLEPGLISRSGWAVVDDSTSLVFNRSGWLEARQNRNNVDLYFFGHGLDFPACLQDYCKIAGKVPLIPRWALGNWWSRYWQYTADELLALMEEFKTHQVPLSVCIVDMDWHLTKTNNTSTGWTGYTWNRELFPDPEKFIQEIHRLKLKTALNLHPAEGIHPHESAYEEFANEMGVDPQTQIPISFDPSDPHFMQGYFELLHHPIERQGIDFWWIDCQQGEKTRLEGLDPLWWLNHLHFYDRARDGEKRPFIFSRWGGLGNHRYPIGFSGDTVVGWDALDFQPGFTAAAANVGYGWWSHDIGGHMQGVEDDELYTRWVQFGVFSPILRLHSTNNPFHERRPWGRGIAAETASKSALRLRHALIPYLYTMARRNHQESLPLILPLYYTHPNRGEAYHCPQIYWFGSELLAAPFTQPAENETGLSRQVAWLPHLEQSEPIWFDFFSGQSFTPGWHTVYGELSDIPVFARPGAIIPLAPDTSDFGTSNPESLRIRFFPGANNRFDLYEDDGETLDYQNGHFLFTPLSQIWSQNHLEIQLGPSFGDRSLVPANRTYQLEIFCIREPDRINFSLNREPFTIEHSYDSQTRKLTIPSFHLEADQAFTARFDCDQGPLLSFPDYAAKRLRRVLSLFRLDSDLKKQIESDWPEIRSGTRPLNSYRELSPAQVLALQSLLE